MLSKDKLLEDLKRDEGFVPHAYRDSENWLTIGYGRLIDVMRGGGITKAEGEYLLANDVEDALKDLDRVLPWWRHLPEPAARGLANMCFNLGLPRLLRFQKMLAALEAGDFEKAAVEALDSRWARQVKGRADRIADLYRSAR